ncbi:uncharacterized protein O3C94_018727 isoform 2-T2 [Discoglossus pictus]
MVKRTVSIFSRSGAEEYKWLKELLSPYVNVRNFYISNTNGRQFREEVSICDSAILYHSKKRGRVNITDVTDSLYDEELEYLSEKLGRARVLVIADDLDESGPDSKKIILHNQPSIGNLATELFVFTTEDQKNKELMRRMIEPMCTILLGHDYKPQVTYTPTPEEKSGPIKKHNYESIIIYSMVVVTGWNLYKKTNVQNALLAAVWAAASARKLCIGRKTSLLPYGVGTSRWVTPFAGGVTLLYILHHRGATFLPTFHS